MQTSQMTLGTPQRRQTSIFTGLLRGYRFTVCQDATSAVRALDVRRRVYVGTCGYDLPVPDAYDERSWLLLAEHVASGEAVGSMRVTPRSFGRLEAEEYFQLPPHLEAQSLVEVTRFAIVSEHRHSKRFLPVVALGLYKLATLFVRQLSADHVVICAKPERSWAYQWLAFTSSGLTTRYEKLNNSEHELLTCDVRRGMEVHRDHRYWDFVFGTEHREVVLPVRVPRVGAGSDPWVQSGLIKRTA